MSKFSNPTVELHMSEEDKFTKFIKYLAKGYKFKIGDAIYCMTETHELGVLVTTSNEIDVAHSNLAVPVSANLNDIWDLAQKVPDNDLFLASANEVLSYTPM